MKRKTTGNHPRGKIPPRKLKGAATFSSFSSFPSYYQAKSLFIPEHLSIIFFYSPVFFSRQGCCHVFSHQPVFIHSQYVCTPFCSPLDSYADFLYIALFHNTYLHFLPCPSLFYPQFCVAQFILKIQPIFSNELYFIFESTPSD